MAAALFGKGIPIKSRSWVWKYFTIFLENTSIAICNTCKLKVSRGNKEKKSKSFNTTNMLCHINIKHKEMASKELKLNAEENKRKAESEKNVFKKIKSTEASCSKQSQQTLFETLARKKPWDINDHRSKLINNYIAEVIAVDIQPFSIVEDIGFQRLLNYICPNYCIPSRKYIKNTVFQNIYDKVRQNIQKEINDASYISFTTDGWASTNRKCSFLSLTAHWLTNKFHQKSAVFRVCQFNVSHTAKNICKAIQSSMNDFFIPASKVHLVARDNAANMAAAKREAGYNSLPCFLHTLQLVLNDTVFA
ncbi:zinc finger BED domain-containing protein 4-like [Hydra vulgaris]|uniref:zinc finger BED domain-containing protein 4-like n=1 Tax=Hydra vulgaris TaxID=6087 RepID=UPI0032EA6F85